MRITSLVLAALFLLVDVVIGVDAPDRLARMRSCQPSTRSRSGRSLLGCCSSRWRSSSAPSRPSRWSWGSRTLSRSSPGRPISPRSRSCTGSAALRGSRWGISISCDPRVPRWSSVWSSDSKDTVPAVAERPRRLGVPDPRELGDLRVPRGDALGSMFIGVVLLGVAVVTARSMGPAGDRPMSGRLTSPFGRGRPAEPPPPPPGTTGT